MHKRQRSLNSSSAAWATIATAVVLFIAASANAQDGTNLVPPTAPPPDMATSSSSAQVPPPQELPPEPRTNMPVVSTSTPPPDETEPANPTFRGNASGTIPLSLDSRIDMLAGRQLEIEDRRALIEQKRQTLQTASSTRRGVLSQNLQNLAIGGLNRVSSLLSSAITRMKDGNARLRARADALQSEGKDMNLVLSLLDEVDASLNLANYSLTGIDVNARFAVTSTSPKEDWQSVRAQFAETRALLLEAKETMQEAIAAMKAAIGGGVAAEINTDTLPVTQ